MRLTPWYSVPGAPQGTPPPLLPFHGQTGTGHILVDLCTTGDSGGLEVDTGTLWFQDSTISGSFLLVDSSCERLVMLACMFLPLLEVKKKRKKEAPGYVLLCVQS